MINSGLFLATTQRERARRRHGARDRARHAAPSGARHDRPVALGPALDGSHAGRHHAGGDRGARRSVRHGRRDPRRAERRHPAPDQLHAIAGIRGRPDRHRHHGGRRLRSARHGEHVRGAEPQFAEPGPGQGGRVSDRSPAVRGACRGSAQSRRTDRPHPSRGFAQLPADARAPALARRQPAKSRASITPIWRRTAAASTSRSATARRSPTSMPASPRGHTGAEGLLPNIRGSRSSTARSARRIWPTARPRSRRRYWRRAWGSFRATCRSRSGSPRR